MKGRTLAVASALAASVCAAAPAPAGLPAERAAIVVSFEDGTTAAQRAAARHASGARLTASIPELGLERWVVPAGSLSNISGVRWAEPDRTLHVMEKPNDPLLGKQWAYGKLSFARAWKVERGVGSPVVVAVIDTGVDPTHPEMEGRLVAGRDFVDGDELPDDVYGHGTGVAAIVAANTDNREGIAGMSWGAKIMPLRTCNEKGGCSMFAVAQAIVFAAARDARVVNLSLGGAMPACPQTLDVASTFAAARGSLLVTSSGNSAQQGNPTNFPAACEGFMAVGATDAADNWAPFSDFGSHVDVSAPGASITTAWTRENSPPETSGYVTTDGTSFAAPHVAGLAALLLSQHPEWTPGQVETRIEETAVDLGPEGRDPWFGHGRIDVVRALKP